nr:putative RNA-directed DNA polymerase, eukaryota, reverse transcriptase zinc-binding domain protein [Tanacetum cinerariifolium]
VPQDYDVSSATPCVSIHAIYVMYCHYIRSLSVMLSSISFHVLYGRAGKVDGLLKKLDRVLSNGAFVEKYLNANAQFLLFVALDHTPFVVIMPDVCRAKPKPFKIANFICNKPKFLPAIKKDEEVMLKQRAKVVWLVAGDFNTRYFHKSVKEKLNRSKIENVEDFNDTSFSGDNVGEQFVKHFVKLFGESKDVSPIQDHSSLFVNKLSQFDAKFMVRPIRCDKIKVAIFSMADDKSSGPYGFSAKFFKSAWSIVVTEVCSAVLVILVMVHRVL